MIREFIKNLSNIPGWRSDRQIVVIESDDWGSIRMPSKAAYKAMEQKGIDLDSGDSKRYNKNDTLAAAEDLEALFEVLTKFKDQSEKHPVFTAVSLSANPDFDKIKKNNFLTYYYEPFTETLRKYGRESAFLLWQEGIDKHLFVPQFHGREHLNVAMWMRALQEGDAETLFAFEYGLWGFNQHKRPGFHYQAAFDLEFAEDLSAQGEVIKTGLAVFEQLHGYKAKFFVPPNGPFNNQLEKVAAEGGIKYMSSSKIQREVLGAGKNKLAFHYLGQRNRHKQIYITRNCFFEPSLEGKDWVSSCLKEIEIAFKLKKPAVISSHRVNYIGSLQTGNRKIGLDALSALLSEILTRWPSVTFLTSDELGDLIIRSRD